ncbi:hypothetical protein R50072_32650 [Simiduia litorea]
MAANFSQAEPITGVSNPLASASGGLVSVNLCVDQMLLRFAERDQITSVTYFADNPLMSPLALQAQGLHRNHGLVEEIIPLQPRLVLAGEYGAREAIELLLALGYPVVRVPLPQKLADIDAHLARMAEILDSPPALLSFSQHWQVRKAQLQAENRRTPNSAKPSALMLGPNHIAPGGGTLEDELLTLAGFQNWAVQQGIQGFASVNLEKLVLNPPDLLIVDQVAAEHFSVAHEVLQHPALARAMQKGDLAALPGNLSVCPAPNINALISTLIELRLGLKRNVS